MTLPLTRLLSPPSACQVSHGAYSTLRQVGLEVSEAITTTLTSLRSFFGAASDAEVEGTVPGSSLNSSGAGVSAGGQQQGGAGGQRLGGSSPLLAPREQLQHMHAAHASPRQQAVASSAG